MQPPASSLLVGVSPSGVRFVQHPPFVPAVCCWRRPPPLHAEIAPRLRRKAPRCSSPAATPPRHPRLLPPRGGAREPVQPPCHSLFIAVNRSRPPNDGRITISSPFGSRACLPPFRPRALGIKVMANSIDSRACSSSPREPLSSPQVSLAPRARLVTACSRTLRPRLRARAAGEGLLPAAARTAAASTFSRPPARRCSTAPQSPPASGKWWRTRPAWPPTTTIALARAAIQRAPNA